MSDGVLTVKGVARSCPDIDRWTLSCSRLQDLNFAQPLRAAEVSGTWLRFAECSINSFTAAFSEERASTNFCDQDDEILAGFLSIVDDRSLFTVNLRVGRNIGEVQFCGDVDYWNKSAATVVPFRGPTVQISFAQDLAFDSLAIPSGVEERLSEIEAFCSNDNWDGEGAYAIDSKVICRVKQLLSLLPKAVLKRLDSASIYPNPDGTISLVFLVSPGELIVIFGNRLITAYTTSDGMITEFQEKLTNIEALIEKFDQLRCAS